MLGEVIGCQLELSNNELYELELGETRFVSKFIVLCLNKHMSVFNEIRQIVL